jgi:hypothetical protein
MTVSLSRFILPVTALTLLSTRLFAQDGVEQRMDALEKRNQELERRIDLLAEEQEAFDLGDVVTPLGDGQWGLGPAASKVYGASGLSIGGYGEAIYQSASGSPAEFDLLRAVLYVGYHFDEHWVFNSELEFEHGGEETGVEFAYLDYLHSDALNARAGLVLIPMGFVNELHEPTAFLGATRPETERRIIPTTWREGGVGLFGDVGPVSYRTYVVNGFDATGFDDAGLRGGRQNGSEALAEDLAFVGRVDWTDTPGLLAGGSLYHGNAGQDTAGLGDTSVSIYELHGEWRWRGLRTRALVAHAEVDDVTELDAFLGVGPNESVGEELSGGYVEAGYDVASLFDDGGSLAVTPFARYETFDTQDEVPAGFGADPANDVDVLTLGVDVKPNDQIVFKVDFQDFDDGEDRVNLSLGYVF